MRKTKDHFHTEALYVCGKCGEIGAFAVYGRASVTLGTFAIRIYKRLAIGINVLRFLCKTAVALGTLIFSDGQGLVEFTLG
jgi:hypothetical protein